MAKEFLRKLRDSIVKSRKLLYFPHDIVKIARQQVQKFEPLLAQHLSDTLLASWLMGFDDVAKRFPPWLVRDYEEGRINRPPPGEPPKPPKFYPMFSDEPRLQLTLIENAAQRLFERNILTRPVFDRVSDEIRNDAFTIAYINETETIDRMRDFLVEELHEGASLEGYRKRVEENLGSSPIAPGHLENVYRTNIQGAFRDGMATIMSDPIVNELFPYQRYSATHDARTRPEHLALEALGIDGTGVYRADDPFWDLFSPPWHYQCRCTTMPFTIEAAARFGVKEAKQWLETGRKPPLVSRLADIPFRPEPGWGYRGRVGYRLSLDASGHEHAPDGSSKGGKFVSSGQAITTHDVLGAFRSLLPSKEHALAGKMVLISALRNEVLANGGTRDEFEQRLKALVRSEVLGVSYHEGSLKELTPEQKDGLYNGDPEKWLKLVWVYWRNKPGAKR